MTMIPQLSHKHDPYAKTGMIADPDKYLQKKEMSQAVPASSASQINNMGFAYLFKDKSFSGELVHQSMMADDGVIRYSQELAQQYNRLVAIAVFRCAQIVYRVRNGHDTNTPMIGTGPFSSQEVLIPGAMIQDRTDISPEDMTETMVQLVNIGVFTRYTAERGGEIIFSNHYTFAEENEYFPPHGQVTFE